MYTPLRERRKKKKDYKESLVRETFMGTNTTFSFCYLMWTRNKNISKWIPSVSHQIRQQFSQSLFRIQTRTRTRRHCGGPRPRRLTKVLQPPSQCPRGTDRSHRGPDDVPTSDWCELGWDTRQGPDQVCFSSLSGSNPRWTSYLLMTKQNRTGTRPWEPTVKQDTSGVILLNTVNIRDKAS